MKLYKYIHQLLSDNEMVIIPGFGAFISEYQPAEIDDKTDEIKPPSTRLVFNPQIRNNDGLLVGHVAEQTRSSHFEALQKIEKERDNIIYQLDKAERVELEDIGVLFYNSDNQIEFISESDKNLSHESFGLEATSLNEPQTGQEDNTEEPEIIEPVTSEEFVADTEDEIETNEVDTPPQEQENDPEEVIIPVPEPIEETSQEKDMVEEEVLIAEPVSVETRVEPAKEKKRKGGLLWLLVVLIPLIAVSVFLYRKDKKTDGTISASEQISAPEIKGEAVASVDTLEKDSTILSQTDSVASEEVAEAKISTPEPSGPKFYLVGGSFTEKENAETYIQVLKDKGFDAYHAGKKGRFFIVGIGTYNTFSEAEKAKKEYMSNNPGSEVWVWKK